MEPWLSIGQPLRMWLSECLMLMINDYVLYTWSNGPCHISLPGLLCTSIKIDDVHLVSFLGSWVSVTMQHNLPMWPLLNKSLSPRDSNGPSWAETFCTCPSSLLLEWKHIVGGPRWGSSRKQVPYLCGFLLIHVFSCGSWSIFALINLSHVYNLLLSLVNSFSKSANLIAAFRPTNIKLLVQCLTNSTHPIQAS